MSAVAATARLDKGGKKIRAGKASEALCLRDLALRAKAHWGYDPDFMAACVSAFTMSEQDFTASAVGVIDGPQGAAGFAKVSVQDETAQLDKMFVDPDAMGQGVGKALMSWACEVARAKGAVHMMIEADPFAAAFYAHCGAVEVSRVPSEAIAGRTLPLLRLAL